MSIVSADKPVLSSGTTSDNGVVPTVHDGNVVTCQDAGCGGTETLEIETGGSYDGTYCVDATHCIVIDAYGVPGTTGENSIDWSSNFDVECIVLKGGDGYDTYYCTDDHKRQDGSMSTPIKSNNHLPSQISHILICYFPPDYNVPEFPSLALPVAFLIGMIGAVQYIRIRKE
jgi:hypothetical protein